MRSTGLTPHCLFLTLGLSLGGLSACQSSSETRVSPGLTRDTIVLGAVMALEGQEEGLGNRMRVGLEAALQGEQVQGRRIELRVKNDYYEPPNALQATRELIQEGIFLMIGNVGTPTAQVTLPVLAEAGIPAVGFFTGASLLRPGPGPTVNYRASYAQEIAAVVQMAIANTLNPDQICAYVQNDSYGMAGLTGLKQALAQAQAPAPLLATYDRILAQTGVPPDRNHIGPVGVYPRNTPYVQPGYESLKAWEAQTGERCQLIVTAGASSNVARFAQYSRAQGETWLISALSFTNADDFQLDLEEYGVTNGIIMTQVVPLVDAELPIVKAAQQALGEQFGYVSLEGYIVGKMVLEIFNSMSTELTPANFMATVKRAKFQLGGLDIDFTRAGHQGSNLVILSTLTETGYRPLTPKALATLLTATTP